MTLLNQSTMESNKEGDNARNNDNLATTALPEELVSRHLADTWDCMLRSKHEYGEKSAAITLDYMGRFAIFLAEGGWGYYGHGLWNMDFDPNEKHSTTPQLIELFFNQNSVVK